MPLLEDKSIVKDNTLVVTILEAARVLGVSSRRISNMLDMFEQSNGREGTLKPIYLPGGKRRYVRRTDLDRLLK